MATDGKLAPAQHAVSGTYQDNSTHTLTKPQRDTLATYIKRNWRQIQVYQWIDLRSDRKERIMLWLRKEHGGADL